MPETTSTERAHEIADTLDSASKYNAPAQVMIVFHEAAALLRNAYPKVSIREQADITVQWLTDDYIVELGELAELIVPARNEPDGRLVALPKWKGVDLVSFMRRFAGLVVVNYELHKQRGTEGKQ